MLNLDKNQSKNQEHTMKNVKRNKSENNKTTQKPCNQTRGHGTSSFLHFLFYLPSPDSLSLCVSMFVDFYRDMILTNVMFIFLSLGHSLQLSS